MSTETLRPNAVGTHTEWPGVVPVGSAHWSVVDEDPPNDSDNIGTSDDLTPRFDSYNIPDTAIPDGATINQIEVFGRAKRLYDANPSSPIFNILIRTNGTDYLSANKTLTDSFQTFSNVWTINPNSGVAWTKSDINALEIGAKGISNRKFVLGIWWWTSVLCSQVYIVITYTISAGITKSIGFIF